MSKAAELANLIGNINAGGGGVNRNAIINGSMNLAQRGTSFTVTNEYGLDRWFCRENTDGALTFSQDSTSPDGFSKSLKVNVDTADSSIGSSQFAYLAQRIEGFNIETFAFGSSAAKTIVLSFYVRCSVTGTFGGAITNGGNDNRSFAFTYDVNSANTWERKSITIVGDTTGTWNIDNSQEMAVFWSLGAGSGHKKAKGSWDATASVQSASEAGVELIGNASATWFITGVQLEVGQNATEFEHEPFERTLEKCQRYFYKEDYTVGSNTTGPFACQYVDTHRFLHLYHPTTMRTTPTSTVSSNQSLTEYQSTIRNYKSYIAKDYDNAETIHLTAYQADAEL
tara:strand:- start:161 stop:1180 length:1020 start_codon:yes stop_codon:yes gene_type:complete